jgi:hypothetical protein
MTSANRASASVSDPGGRGSGRAGAAGLTLESGGARGARLPDADASPA